MLNLKNFMQYLARTARLMVGLPDYQAYVEHRQRSHPGETIMTYAEFFRERQQRRYGTNGHTARCC